MANVEGTAADDMRRHRLDAFGDDLLFALRYVGFAPAVQAVLGLDPTEQEVLRAAGAEDEGLDPRDLHWVPSRCSTRRHFEPLLRGSRAMTAGVLKDVG